MASSLLLETQDSLLATAHPLISLETQLGTLTVIIFPHLILLLEYFIHGKAGVILFKSTFSGFYVLTLTRTPPELINTVIPMSNTEFHDYEFTAVSVTSGVR